MTHRGPQSAHQQRLTALNRGRLVNAKDLENEHWPLRYFVPSELQCKCCRRVFDSTKARQAWRQLDRLRLLMGEPIYLTSATRCAKHNASVGGVPNSKHILGYAFDIRTRGIGQRASFEIRLLHAAGYLGFGGIGVYQTFMHLDCRPLDRMDRPTVWFG